MVIITSLRKRQRGRERVLLNIYIFILLHISISISTSFTFACHFWREKREVIKVSEKVVIHRAEIFISFINNPCVWRYLFVYEIYNFDRVIIINQTLARLC